ncbi:MAG: DUF4251 domain-containing protein [Bacteroidetes bacterium]|nr:DUF4251 domain-containing protein [Bacteroidota bacterium]
MKRFTTLCLLALTLSGSSNAQSSELGIREQSYVFKPSFILTELGLKKMISHPEQYYLRVTPDSIICFLPAPKRRYKAGAIPMKEGKPDFSKITFEEKFAIRGYRSKVKEETKNETQIQLVPKAKGRILQVRLNVLPGGGTTLAIGNTDYEAITYAGRIAAVSLPNKKHK